MRNIARFVVDTHSHITTLYMPEGESSVQMQKDGIWNGLNGYIEHFDNSDFAVRDMDRYGVDMGVLLPSMIGCTNAAQLAIMDKYPGRFAACCCDGDTVIKHYKNKDLKYDFQESLDEIDAALKTGRFSGIGEFPPGLNTSRIGAINPPPTFEERFEQWKGIAEVAVKYDVPVHYHDFNMPYSPGKMGFDYNNNIARILSDNPKVKIIASHGGKDPMPKRGCKEAMEQSIYDQWKDFYQMAAGRNRLYLECGGWSTHNFEVAFDCGVRACNVMWGHDYGNVPQYLFRRGHLESMKKKPGVQMGHSDQRMWEHRLTDSLFGGVYEGFPPVPTYQSDFYGWGMRTIDRVGDWLTQDEINLIMGGTAARLYKLPVPCSRMFPEARPDIFGENWKEEWYPFIPDAQILKPDLDADGNIYRLPTDC